MAVFAPSGPSPSSTVALQGSISPTIANVVIATANTEESYTIPAGTKQFSLRVRGTATLKLAYSLGTSGTNYFTIYPGETLDRSLLTLSTGLIIYFQTNLDSQILEIESWV